MRTFTRVIILSRLEDLYQPYRITSTYGMHSIASLLLPNGSIRVARSIILWSALRVFKKREDEIISESKAFEAKTCSIIGKVELYQVQVYAQDAGG